MNNITLKNAANVDTVFTVIRQPSGSLSAILHAVNDAPGLNQTAFAKIEISSAIRRTDTKPVVTVSVPYGSIVDGNFVRTGVVNHVAQATLPATAPSLARADAEAYAKSIVANPQVVALFQTGAIS